MPSKPSKPDYKLEPNEEMSSNRCSVRLIEKRPKAEGRGDEGKSFVAHLLDVTKYDQAS